MSKGSILLSATLALGVSACSSQLVSDRFFVDRNVMLTDKVSGDPISPLCREDELSENNLGKGKRRGMPLRPGDVINLMIWSPGRTDQGADSKTHLTPPTFDLVRIPLRKVSSQIRAGESREWYEFSVLNDIERMFLVNALTTNRKAELGGDAAAKEWIENHMIQLEGALWNEFVDSLRVRRVDKQGRKKQCKRENGDIEKLSAIDMVHMSHGVVSMTFDMSALYKRLDEEDQPKFAKAFNVKNNDASDILGFRQRATTPYAEMSGRPVSKKERNASYYITTNDPYSQAFINFISVEVNGLDFRSPQMPERAWSLYEVEKANVCGDDAKVVGFTFKDNGPTYTVVDAEKHAGYEVKRHNVPRDGEIYTYQVGTEIRPIKGAISSRLLYGNSVSRQDLAKIYIADVRAIEWQGMPKNKNAKYLRARCLFN